MRRRGCCPGRGVRRMRESRKGLQPSRVRGQRPQLVMHEVPGQFDLLGEKDRKLHVFEVGGDGTPAAGRPVADQACHVRDLAVSSREPVDAPRFRKARRRSGSGWPGAPAPRPSRTGLRHQGQRESPDGDSFIERWRYPRPPARQRHRALSAAASQRPAPVMASLTQTSGTQVADSPARQVCLLAPAVRSTDPDRCSPEQPGAGRACQDGPFGPGVLSRGAGADCPGLPRTSFPIIGRCCSSLCRSHAALRVPGPAGRSRSPPSAARTGRTPCPAKTRPPGRARDLVPRPQPLRVRLRDGGTRLPIGTRNTALGGT